MPDRPQASLRAAYPRVPHRRRSTPVTVRTAYRRTIHNGNNLYPDNTSPQDIPRETAARWFRYSRRSREILYTRTIYTAVRNGTAPSEARQS